MGQVYPIARGSAPLMTAVISTTVVGEHLNVLSWIGVVTLAGGVLLLSARGGRDLVRIDRRALGFAFFTAATICGYSLVDGIGARVSPQPACHVADLSVVDAGCMILFALARRGRAFVTVAGRQWRPVARWRALFRRVLDCHLGDDGYADRDRRGVARDQRVVRRSHRDRISQGAAACSAHYRGRGSRLRPCIYLFAIELRLSLLERRLARDI